MATNKYEAIHNFWSSFSLPAYDENSVPTGDNKPDFPYITYDVVVSDFGESVAMSASVWYYGSSWAEISAKMDEISAAISRGGVQVPCDNGTVWIRRGSPFAQRMSDPNDMVRRFFMNISVEYTSAD